MKVGELIQELQKFDPELRIVVDGYESGFNDIHFVRAAKAIIDCDLDTDFNGDHESLYNELDALYYKEKYNKDTEDVVFIPSIKKSLLKKMK